MNVTLLNTAADAALWDAFVLSRPDASGYHTLAWREVVRCVFGHPTFYLMAKDDHDTVRGVLPLILTRSPVFGSFLTSLAFFNYGGILAEDRRTTEELLARAGDLARELGAGHIELRQAEPLETDWPVSQHKVSMRLALPSDSESLFKAYPSKLRSQIRRGQKEGMKVHIGGAELLNDYYKVFSRCMRDLGTPVYEKGFFRAIIDAFPKETRLFVVSLQQKPLAAGFVYGFRRVLEIPWAASDKRYGRLAPNMLLYHAVLEYACGEGFTEFDFGRSSVDSGTYRFKQQWGAQPRPLYWYYWLARGRGMPQLNPDNPKFKVAISLWRRLPLFAANLIGPHIVKYLP